MEKGMPLVRIQGAPNAGAIVHGEWERCIRLLRLNPFGGFKPEYFGSVFHISFGGTSGLNSVLKCSTQSTLRCLDRVTCLFVCTLWICRMRMSKL